MKIQGVKVRRIKNGAPPEISSAPSGEFCACIASALANVPPLRANKNGTCARCAPYHCDSVFPRHPVSMTKALRERLKKAPYFRIAGKSSQVYARRLAQRQTEEYLKSVWAKEAAGEKLVYVRRIGE